MSELEIGQRICFKPTAWDNRSFNDVITRINGQFAITEQNQVIDIETKQWIQPNGHRTFSPGRFYIEQGEQNGNPQFAE